MESTNFVEGVSRGDRVDEEETFSRSHVLFTHRSAGVRARQLCVSRVQLISKSLILASSGRDST